MNTIYNKAIAAFVASAGSLLLVLHGPFADTLSSGPVQAVIVSVFTAAATWLIPNKAA